MPSLVLPGSGSYTLSGKSWPTRAGTPVARNRIAYAAAHVVADPLADIDPHGQTAIDWDRTMAYRRHLWSLGFAVAEAMDTAQRGMGMDFAHSLELIRRSVLEAKAFGAGASLASGAGTDHLPPDAARDLDDVVDAYRRQCAAVEAAGSPIILMASRALARIARGPEDYLTVYRRVLAEVSAPVILHWLGEMFDPALQGYWGSRETGPAMATALAMIEENRARIDGIKISLLSAEAEIEMRAKLPAGVRMYTGDAFNYPELIAGDGDQHSDALLGIFDAIAPVAAAALDALGAGDRQGFRALLDPTVPMSRHLFKAPTQYYKTGIVFLAWLNGFQDHHLMVDGQESARSTRHFAELFRLTDQAGLFRDPERAASRMRAFLALRGF